MLELLGIDGDLRLSINPQRSSRRLIALDREVSVRELLTHFVELVRNRPPAANYADSRPSIRANRNANASRNRGGAGSVCQPAGVPRWNSRRAR